MMTYRNVYQGIAIPGILEIVCVWQGMVGGIDVGMLEAWGEEAVEYAKAHLVGVDGKEDMVDALRRWKGTGCR